MEQTTQAAPGPEVVALDRLAAEATQAGGIGAIWSLASADLNLNLVRLAPGEAVAAYVNDEVDVVGLVVAGAGTLALDTRRESLREGLLFFVPKGTRRAISAASSGLVYLTCHRRRGRLTIGRRRP
jgi:quercetin dioxygenase-like cupin family protein